MSDQMIRLTITGALALHGLGHGGALGALLWICLRPGSNTGGWLAARSWLIPSLPADTATTLAGVLWIASLVGFVAAAFAFSGVVLPSAAWRPLAVAAAIVSLSGIVAFMGTWPTFNTLAALGMNVAVLVALLWAQWPPQAMFGK